MRRFLLLILMLWFPIPQLLAGPIHDAAKSDDVAAITAALDAGADIEANEGGGTPLYFAIKRGHFAAAKFLLERGANANALTKYSGPALFVAASKTRSDLMALLVAHGADLESALQSETALHVSAKLGCLDCVNVLVEAGANVNAITTGDYGRTPIHLARLYEYGDVADYLMAHGVVLPRPSPISAKIAGADAKAGQIFFERNCNYCHLAKPSTIRMRGPNLWNVVGRAKHSLPGHNYSKAFLAMEGTWTYEDLNSWLNGFAAAYPGVMMEIPGITDETERANLIAYLRSLSDTPILLP